MINESTNNTKINIIEYNDTIRKYNLITKKGK